MLIRDLSAVANRTFLYQTGMMITWNCWAGHWNGKCLWDGDEIMGTLGGMEMSIGNGLGREKFMGWGWEVDNIFYHLFYTVKSYASHELMYFSELKMKPFATNGHWSLTAINKSDSLASQHTNCRQHTITLKGQYVLGVDEK